MNCGNSTNKKTRQGMPIRIINSAIAVMAALALLSTLAAQISRPRIAANAQAKNAAPAKSQVPKAQPSRHKLKPLPRAT
jgi:hypothetical protein